jgi:hypothetical protein
MVSLMVVQGIFILFCAAMLWYGIRKHSQLTREWQQTTDGMLAQLAPAVIEIHMANYGWHDFQGQFHFYFSAQLGHEPDYFDTGKSVAEAIGGLILRDPERLGFDVVRKDILPAAAPPATTLEPSP